MIRLPIDEEEWGKFMERVNNMARTVDDVKADLRSIKETDLKEIKDAIGKCPIEEDGKTAHSLVLGRLKSLEEEKSERKGANAVLVFLAGAAVAIIAAILGALLL